MFIVASITAKVVIGTILKTAATGALFGGSAYVGAKATKKVFNTVNQKKAQSTATESHESACGKTETNTTAESEATTEKTTEEKTEEVKDETTNSSEENTTNKTKKPSKKPKKETTEEA